MTVTERGWVRLQTQMSAGSTTNSRKRVNATPFRPSAARRSWRPDPGTPKQGRPWMELGAPASYRPEASPSCLMSQILNNTTSSRLTPTLPGNLVLRGPPAQGP